MVSSGLAANPTKVRHKLDQSLHHLPHYMNTLPSANNFLLIHLHPLRLIHYSNTAAININASSSTITGRFVHCLDSCGMADDFGVIRSLSVSRQKLPADCNEYHLSALFQDR